MTKSRILIVEDEPIIARDIQECLESFGYEVDGPVVSGDEAIELATARLPSLVLMDIMLRGSIDGIMAANKIHSQLDIPVIFLTAYADSATLARAKVTDPSSYIVKPFRKMELRIVIELALFRHNMERERQQALDQRHRPTPGLDAVMAECSQQPNKDSDNQYIVNLLQNVMLFRNLDLDDLTAIAKICRLEDFHAKQFLVQEGEDNIWPFLVAEGRVALVKSSINGKDLVVEHITAGDPFGLLAIFEKGVIPYALKAQAQSKILWIPRKIVSYFLDLNVEICRELIAEVLGRLRNSHDLSRSLAHDRVEVRVASTLLSLLRESNEKDSKMPIEIKLSRQELAEMTGTAPETASRVANALEHEGILDLSQHGCVRILNRDGLTAIATV